jgi:two-component system cell cycle sensor histidine kinase PleC
MGRVLSPSERLPDGAHLASDHRRERAKDSFLAAMSHELRTPLNAIIGFAELIDAEVFGPLSVPQYHTYVRDIAGSARHLLQIIEDVLEISRAEAGELVLNKREIDIDSLIARSLVAVHGQIQSKRIQVVTHVPDGVVIQVDPEKMTRVLASLLSNAVKFSAEGTIVSLAMRLGDCGTVTIAVQDQGIGMEAKALERAFAPFVQLDDNLSRQFDGSGLGLAIARLLAELHGGSIRLDSAPGVGTTATLALPAYARVTSCDTTATARSASSSFPRATEKVKTVRASRAATQVRKQVSQLVDPQRLRDRTDNRKTKRFAQP